MQHPDRSRNCTQESDSRLDSFIRLISISQTQQQLYSAWLSYIPLLCPGSMKLAKKRLTEDAVERKSGRGTDFLFTRHFERSKVECLCITQHVIAYI
ncbi:hypothetical protein VNO77_24495 [Canavalia gladiata]|uniref:Uncharacterized protein n=1 Tax=Canavalia gladiata TaxID=3824 RepID=A0AAN9Q9Z9_CANGL